MQRQTTMIKTAEVKPQWFVIDASVAPLGRLASRIAEVLMGKHKPEYTPHLDTGDYVIVINASKAVLTGDKKNKKIYYTQVSQQPGGLRSRSAKVMIDKYPEEMIEHAVKGMLPKGPLGRKMRKKLFVYAGGEHPHQGQNPTALGMK